MADKPDFTPEQMVAALRETKGLIYLAAKRLGCHPHTVSNYAKRYPEVRDAITAQRGEMVDAGESSLYRAVLAGEAWAVQFLLKTQGKDRGYVERTEHRHGADQQAGLTDEDRQQQLHDLARRVRQRDSIPALPATGRLFLPDGEAHAG
jgi:hypothetical protein